MTRIKIKDLPKDTKISKAQMKQIFGGNRNLYLLASVAHLKAKRATSDLSSIAQRQKDILSAKDAIRDAQDAYDAFT